MKPVIIWHLAIITVIMQFWMFDGLAADGDFVWVKQMGGGDLDLGYRIIVDNSGGRYITGGFCGTANFNMGAGTHNLTSAGGYDIFLWKLTGPGNFAWAGRLGGAGDDYGQDIALDRDGNLYVTGSFMGTGDFDSGPGVFNLTSGGGVTCSLLSMIIPVI